MKKRITGFIKIFKITILKKKWFASLLLAHLFTSCDILVLNQTLMSPGVNK